MNLKSILVAGPLLAVLFSVSACHQNTSGTSTAGVDSAANHALASLFHNYFERSLKLHPLDASFVGDKRYNDQLANDQTEAYRNSMQEFYAAYRDSVSAIDRSRLSGENRISYDVFLYNLKMELEGLSLHTWMMPFSQNGGLPLSFGVLCTGASYVSFKNKKDYYDWLSRIRLFTVWCDSAIANFREGMKAGVVLPKALVVKMIPQMESMVVKDPEKSPFFKPVRNLPDSISAADSLQIARDYKKAILTEVVPTYRKLADFLKNDYLPRARTSSGISAVPGGKEIYDYQVRYFTTLDETPAEVYQVGLDQVNKIGEAIDSVKDAIGFRGDRKSLLQYLRTDRKFFPFKTPDQVLDSFRAIYNEIKPRVKSLYGRFPRAPFVIKRVPKFLEQASGVPYYDAGSPDGSKPGTFYVPIPDATRYNATSMDCAFLHEAIPGHHYQLSLQMEDTSLPRFRRFNYYGAYVEGYALYAESLGKELGLYHDPYQYLGYLSWQMMRAVRLVVDVAIHTGKMNREEAIAYVMDHVPLDRHIVTAEIERYMAWPGQALSYMTGKLEIMALRHQCQKELGDRFSLSAFHDELLQGGSLPLKILDQKMDAWARGLAAQQ